MDRYAASCNVIQSLVLNGLNPYIRGEASGLFKVIRSFEFVFVLHLMDKTIGYSEILCQALQRKSQDILNAIRLVSSTNDIFLGLRQDGWDNFLQEVFVFCARHNIKIPNMSRQYKYGRACQEDDPISVEQHYHVEIFNSAIDFQLMELNNRFNETTIELLTLSAALDPTDCFKSFNVDNICNLALKFYPADFTQ